MNARSKPLSPESFFGFDRFRVELHDAKREAKRRASNLEKGEKDEKGRPISPYRALRQILLEQARDLRALERHVHSYDDRDLCRMCGHDGRA